MPSSGTLPKEANWIWLRLHRLITHYKDDTSITLYTGLVPSVKYAGQVYGSSELRWNLIPVPL